MNKAFTLLILLAYLPLRLPAQCNPDTVAPSIIAIQGQSAIMPPTNKLTIWWDDLIDYSQDNCTPQNNLQFAIRIANAGGSEFPTDAYGNPNLSITFSCDNIGEQLVEVWVQDEAGNAGMDTAVIYISDPNFQCGDPLLIQTCGKTEDNQFVENVTWYLDYIGSVPGIPNPHYVFSGVCNYVIPFPIDSVKITPLKTDNPLNGVSTFDLVLINKHVLGLETLDSPYKLLAADANHSRSITTFDIVELRKLILGIYTQLPGSFSWGFVPTAFHFPNPSNPFQTPVPASDTLNFDNYQDEHHFIGYKVGDVNGSALTKAQHPEPDTRSIQTLELEDRLLRPGETARIPLRLRKEVTLLGLQCAFQFDPEMLEISGVDFNHLQESGADYFAQPAPGLLTLSWDDPSAPAFGAEETVFALEVKAHRAILLSRALRLLPEHRLRPELYTASGETHALALEFTAPDQIIRTETFDVSPNPSTNEPVAISFALAEPAPVTIEVFDLAGRQLYYAEQHFPAGMHQLHIPAAALYRQTGILCYHFRNGQETFFGKILRI